VIGHFVDCPENYGDLLYPVVFEKIISGMGVNTLLERYSFLEGEAPLCAGYQVRSIQRLLVCENQKIPKVLVIGGGEILRASQNKESAYLSLYLKRGLPLPLFFRQKHYLYSICRRVFSGSYLYRIFRRIFRISYFNKFFARRYMNYPSVGPYIINPKDINKEIPVIYCSCGGGNSFPFAIRKKVKAAFEQSRFVYLRDEITRDRLIECGVKKDMHVAPDLIIALSDYFNIDEESRKGRKILAKYGVSVNRKVLLFQSFPVDEAATEEIIHQLNLCIEQYDVEIGLLPLGYCHNDHIFLHKLEQCSKGAFKYLPIRPVFDMLSVISASDFFIGTSMHGNITAFSYGKPFLIAPTGRPKQQGFLKMAELG
jgi:hypothetical protein